MGLSSRPGPDNPTGPSSTQVSYGPNRTVDWNYYSFAYTRLQEQDWAELFVHEKQEARRRRRRLDGVLVPVGRLPQPRRGVGARAWPT